MLASTLMIVGQQFGEEAVGIGAGSDDQCGVGKRGLGVEAGCLGVGTEADGDAEGAVLQTAGAFRTQQYLLGAAFAMVLESDGECCRRSGAAAGDAGIERHRLIGTNADQDAAREIERRLENEREAVGDVEVLAAAARDVGEKGDAGCSRIGRRKCVYIDARSQVSGTDEIAEELAAQNEILQVGKRRRVSG